MAPKEPEPKRVALYDTSEMKMVLDEAVISVFTDEGHRVDQWFSNARILAGFLACACSAGSHFWPPGWPGNYNAVIAFLLLYGVFGVAAQSYLAWIEDGVFLRTLPKKGAKVRFFVKSTLPRYSDKYTLHVFTLRADQSKVHADNKPRTADMSTTWFFDSNGVLLSDAVRKHVLSLLKQA